MGEVEPLLLDEAAITEIINIYGTIGVSDKDIKSGFAEFKIRRALKSLEEYMKRRWVPVPFKLEEK